jgi:Vacuolar protein sorting-associated protein 62
VKRITIVAVAAVTTAVALASAAGGSGSASPPLSKLLARHVPVLVLHPAERFRPVAVDGFLSDSDLTRKTSAGWVKVEGPLPSGGAEYRLDQRHCRAIDGAAASSCYASAEAAHGSGPVVYGAAFRAKGRIDLQYWLWYPYNDYSPTVPAGEIWQVHEGDWEAVSVITDRTGKPLLAGYSQHSKGKRRDWAKVAKRGDRPLVYVGLGSHANYFAPGVIPLDPRTTDIVWIRLIEGQGVKPIEHTGGGPTVRPRLVRVTSRTPSWMRFAGKWGETGYVHFANNPVIEAGAGPDGPALHRQWRFPVTEVLSWPKG